MSDGPVLGRLIDGVPRRDAIHVAVAPVQAVNHLLPGDHVRLVNGLAYWVYAGHPDAVGIVDPFLTVNVAVGQRFWLLLYPGSITGLRHVWQHPAFVVKAPAQEATS